MSSSVHLFFDDFVTLKDWHIFCPKYDIQYSPKTLGQNVFYYGGIGIVEITFGAPNYEELPMFGDMVLFSAASPKPEAIHITVSSFADSNFDKIDYITKKIIETWPNVKIACDDALLLSHLHNKNNLKIFKGI